MSSTHLYEVIFSFVFLEMRTLRHRQDKGPGQVAQVSGGSLIGSKRTERGEVAWVCSGAGKLGLTSGRPDSRSGQHNPGCVGPVSPHWPLDVAYLYSRSPLFPLGVS